jgi:hypothetical protein
MGWSAIEEEEEEGSYLCSQEPITDSYLVYL